MGSENTTIEAHPHQITLEKDGYHHCGGSIISLHYILTAAHCLRYPIAYLRIRAGTSIREENGSLHHIDRIVPYKVGFPNNTRSTIDIALVKVRQPFEFDATRQPIDLFEAGEETEPGTKAVVTGWGSIWNGGPAPNQLQSVILYIVGKSECEKAYNGIDEGEICAGEEEDSCQGDSGGPLTIGGRLAGVVSWGYGCGKPGYPGVYAEVAYFRDWIDEHVEV